MNWNQLVMVWQGVILILAFIAAGIFSGIFISWLIKRFIKKRGVTTTPTLITSISKRKTFSSRSKNQLRSTLTKLLAEVKYNRKVADTNLIYRAQPFRSQAWNSCQHETGLLPQNLLYDLSQSYVYIDLANKFISYSSELGNSHTQLDVNSRDLYCRLAEMLAEIEPLLENAIHDKSENQPSSPLISLAAFKLKAEPRILEALVYLLVIAVAQVVGIFDLTLSIVCHILITIIIVIHSALLNESLNQSLVLPLLLVPVLRIISIIIPQGNIPPILLYYFSYTPLLIAAIFIMGMLGYTPKQVGLNFQRFPIQLAVGLTGILFAVGMYLISSPESIIYELTFQDLLLPALVLLSVGFMQEFIFRGILQRGSIQVFSKRGIFFVSALFSITYIGFIPIIGLLYLFFVSLFYSWVVRKTESILGVSLSNGIAIVLTYIIFPYIL